MSADSSDAHSTDRPAVVLVSGGIDSAVCLAMVRQRTENPVAVVVDYGQRSRRELDAAAALTACYGATEVRVPLDVARWAGGSALTGDGDLDDGRATYVPARNLLLLSVAVSVAESVGAGTVWIGSTASDHQYPDCRPDFIAQFQATADLATVAGRTGGGIRVTAPLSPLSKAQVVTAARTLEVPLALTWSCYGNGPEPCGTCPACRIRAEAFADAGADDPGAAT